jgi:hypothetical protein
MNTIQPSIEPQPSTLSDWLADAISLVQRVNARLSTPARRAPAPTLRFGRRVLTDNRCLQLAGLADQDDVG